MNKPVKTQNNSVCDAFKEQQLDGLFPLGVDGSGT